MSVILLTIKIWGFISIYLNRAINIQVSCAHFALSKSKIGQPEKNDKSSNKGLPFAFNALFSNVCFYGISKGIFLCCPHWSSIVFKISVVARARHIYFVVKTGGNGNWENACNFSLMRIWIIRSINYSNVPNDRTFYRCRELRSPEWLSVNRSVCSIIDIVCRVYRTQHLLWPISIKFHDELGQPIIWTMRYFQI